MKRFTLPLILFFVLFLSERSFGQTIVYDFKNPDTLIGSLPFDRPFRLKFINIDTTKVNSIVVHIYEVGVSNYRKLLRDAVIKPDRRSKVTPRIAITNQDVIYAKGKMIIAPDSIVKYIHFADTVAYMASLITLRPSSDYLIEVNTWNSVPISDAEKDNVKAAIRNDQAFLRPINALAVRNLMNPDMSMDDELSKVSNQINAAVIGIVKKVKKEYNYHPVNLVRPLIKLFDDIGNISSKLKVIEDNFQTLHKPDSLVNIVKQKFKAVDWTQVNKNAQNYQDVKAFINSQKDSLVKKDKSGAARNLEGALVVLDQAVDHMNDIINKVIPNILAEHVDKGSATAATYPKEFLKQAGEFIRSDLGLAYVWGIGRVNPYVAAQISLGPLDDSIPLREFKGFGNFMRSRLSFLIGISVDAVAKDSVRRGLIGSQALILGTGFKLWQWLKVNSGFYMYYREPKNPLQDRSRLSFKASPFVSLSIDIRIQSLLNGVGNAIFKTQTP